MFWEVDVSLTDPATDHAAGELVAAANQLGLAGCPAARTAAGWLIEGNLSRADVERIAALLLADPVTETFTAAEIGAAGLTAAVDGLSTVVHVLPRPGVTDPAGLTAAEALAMLGHPGLAVRSLKKYWLPAMEPAAAAAAGAASARASRGLCAPPWCEAPASS